MFYQTFFIKKKYQVTVLLVETDVKAACKAQKACVSLSLK